MYLSATAADNRDTNMPFSRDRDTEILRQVHPDRQRVIFRAVQTAPFPIRVTEGLRTRERQQDLSAQGWQHVTIPQHQQHFQL